jgi:KaiC/GvpD/RAD55 family RecA-like ATPase
VVDGDGQRTAEVGEMTRATRYYGVDDYARAKDLYAEKLRAWGYYDYHTRRAVAMPERDMTGREINLKLRHPDGSPNRFTYPTYRYPIPAGLWRLPEWGDADTIYLCEGETDMVTMWHADLPALGIPGAEKWRAEWWLYTLSFERVVLIPDADDAGAGLAQKLAETCPDSLRERVQVLRLPDGIKDANELWKQVRGIEDPERFREALAQCAVQPITAIPTEDEQELALQLAHTREREIAHALVPNLLYAERITILAGEAGVGKTTFALEIADALTRTGNLWGGTVEVQRGRVLWLDFDHDWGRLQEIVDAYYGECERELYTIPREQLVPLEPTTLPLYRRAIERYGIDLIVADTAFDWLAVMDANDETEARAKLQLVRELIASTGCGVLLLHHLRKSAHDTTSTLALSGAHRWAAKVDAVAYLRHNSREGQDIVKLIVPKDRDGERRELEFLRQGRRFIPLQREAVPAGDWGVVRAHLQAHGEATYRELLDALSAAGERMTERALQHRVKRWEHRGRVVIERRGFPAVAVVKLAAAQFTHSNTLSQTHGQTGQTGQTESEGLNSTTHAEHAASVYPDHPVCPVYPVYPPAIGHGQTGDSADLPPNLFANRTPFESCIPADLLQAWLPQGIADADLDAVQVMLAYAEARGFPALVVDGYTIHGDLAGWLTAAGQLAGKPAVRTATRLLHALDAGGVPHAPTHNTLLRNGDAGATPSQLSLMEG